MKLLQWLVQNWQAVCGWITGLFVLFKLLNGFTKIVLAVSSAVERFEDAEHTLALLATNHFPHMQAELERSTKILDSMDTTLRKMFDKHYGEYE
jgi:hypothetical protein